MRVRDATRADLSSVAEIARRGWLATYRGLLAHDTVSGFMATTYSLATLRNRLADHPMFVVDNGGTVVAFADALVESDRTVVADLFTDQGWRRRGCARMLVRTVSQLAPTMPTSADIYLGHEAAERFYEGYGFVPGETLQRDLFGQQVVERRWWLSPLDVSTA